MLQRNSPQRYRLGLDLGSNSIGWFVIWLDDRGEPVGLGPGGVRIFPDGRDPQSKTSNAVTRRVARGARRRRDRYLARRAKLMDQLIAHGLMPDDEAGRKALEALDPYELRARALDEPLPAHHVGRALFHLNQRRGFKSNRKTDATGDDTGAIKVAAGRLRDQMEDAGARTLGEFLYSRHAERAPVRARNRSTGTKAEYDFYPTRDLLEGEFDAIWTAQAPNHPGMTDAARDEIRHTIFFQRPLRTPPAGKCSLDPATSPDDLEGFRCPWAHPLAQRFRIWQEVRNLAVTETGRQERTLDKEDSDRIALALMQSNKVTFDKMRSLLKLPPEALFNLESEKRKELLGDQTAAKLAHKNLFGKAWRGFPIERQVAIVERLLDEPDPSALVAWLVANADVGEEAAMRIAGATLPDGHCRLGLRAIGALLQRMEAGMNYPDAATAEYGSHSNRDTGEILDRLPYYGDWLRDEVVGTGDRRDGNEKRWGRFPNPTVHIGLGQLRRLVNALVKRYGPPAEIVVEMTRDFKLSPKLLARLEKEQAENQRRNEARREELEKLGQAATHTNLLKMRLWEELNADDPMDRRCPFSGEMISIERLLSDEVEVEHLIPFSTCWDDSAANKVVCMRWANRAKGNRTPYDAFGSSPTIDGHRYDWEQISARATALPRNKRWRFAPDAATRFKEEGGFIARQLNETGWLARVAVSYMSALTGRYKVRVIPGRMTAMIRAKWGFNTLLPDHNFTDAKNRADHRHHAIDALVAGLTDRSLLHRMASAHDEERDRVVVPPPWDSLRDDLAEKLAAMVVSYKPEHGLMDRLHEDTAYGTVADPEKEDGNLVYRKPLTALRQAEIARIRDVRLREMVAAHVQNEMAEGRTLPEALGSFSGKTADPYVRNGVRRVRLLKSEKPEYLVSIKDGAGRRYKAYSAGANAFIDIIELPDVTWAGEATTVFAANCKGTAPDWGRKYPDARFIMRVFKGDLLSIDHEGEKKIVRAVRLEASANRLRLAEHNEAGNLANRHQSPEDPFRWIFGTYERLREWNAQLVRVDELGCVWRVPPDEAVRKLYR